VPVSHIPVIPWQRNPASGDVGGVSTPELDVFGCDQRLGAKVATEREVRAFSLGADEAWVDCGGCLATGWASDQTWDGRRPNMPYAKAQSHVRRMTAASLLKSTGHADSYGTIEIISTSHSADAVGPFGRQVRSQL